MINLADQYCESAEDGIRLKRPPSVIECQGPCEGVRWMYGQWSACSSTCGGGIMYRTAVCVDSESKTLEDDKCSAIVPEKTQECGIESCPEWKSGDWTEVNQNFVSTSKISKELNVNCITMNFFVFQLVQCHLWNRNQAETLLV